MLFNSFDFLGFLVVVLVVYYLVPSGPRQVGWLILASLVFYSVEDPKLVLLLLGSIALNYGVSRLVSAGPLPRRFRWLVVGISLNLSALALFKYGPLVCRTFDIKSPLEQLPLPIGISFFTFEGIMILVDSWRDSRDLDRPLRWTDQLGRVALLISFFPHLVSGPIVKARDFFPQVGRKLLKDVDLDLAFRSLIVGYFLKLVVADNLKEQTSHLQNGVIEYFSRAQLTAMLFGYSMQIFADFAGYSLIAIGLAALFGYRLPENFRYPYLAASFSEFWQRWHITLSSFLRDYLYIPLGGNRKGRLRTYFNIMVVMGLGGLWHGAAWSYAVWGLAHGVALVVERILGDLFPKVRLWRPLRIATVFLYVSFCWILFKLTEIEGVWMYLKTWWNNPVSHTNWRQFKAILLFSLPVPIYHLSSVYYPPWLKRREYLVYGLLIFLILTNSGPPATFIYFQF